MDAARRAQLNEAMARLARGDRSAADEVFALVWPAVSGFARRWLSGSPHAEDVAQRAVIRVFEQAPDYRVEQDALSWALEVTAWECRTERQRVARGRTEGWTAAAARAPAASTPEAEVEAAELSRALEEVVAGLPEADRAEVQRVVQEAAAGDAAARKRRQRALERLKRLWRSLHGDA